MPRTITETTEVYTAAELQKLFPAAFEKVCDRERTFASEFYSDDIAASFKALFDALSGVRLKDWCFSSYGRDNRCRVEFSQDEAGELSGKRAASWFENNLFAGLRAVPGIGTYKTGGVSHHFTDWGKESAAKHFGGKRYSRHNAVGQVPECPLTGMCYDETLLNAIREGIRNGETVREILESMADTCGEMLESEEEYAGSPAAVIETADANGWEFTEEGEIA